ncbi:MAG: hypothetical protein PVI57_12200 [Gemmatimonadota bacterium]|jgi:hypothetical protein
MGPKHLVLALLLPLAGAAAVVEAGPADTCHPMVMTGFGGSD